MSNTNRFRNTAITFLFVFTISACSGDRWNGGVYEGEATINNVRPPDAKPQKFSLVTSKPKRSVRMDPANTILANCDIPIDDKYTAGIEDDARFTFEQNSAVCNGITVSSGDLTLQKENGTVSVVVVPPDGRTYALEIKGIRK